MSSVDFRSASLSELAHSEAFIHRHIGPDAEQTQAMLKQLGVNSLAELVDQSLPESIRSTPPLDLGPPMTEHQALAELKVIVSKNKIFKSYIGMRSEERRVGKE